VETTVRGPLTRLPVHEAVVAVVLLQVFFGSVAAAVPDGGGCFLAYSCGLAVFWLGIILFGKAAWRSWPGRLYAELGWVLMLALALWLRMRLFA